MRRQLLALSVACVCASGARAEQTLSLPDAILHGLRPLAELRQSLDPVTDPACLELYLASVPSYSPLWRKAPPRSAEAALPALQQNLVEQMIALLGEGTRGEASAFVQAFPLTIEWEGMMQNPLAEADFVASWLAGHPGSILAPFLHLLLAHRLDAAWRFAPSSAKPALNHRFEEALAPALANERPAIACLAREQRTQHARAR